MSATDQFVILSCISFLGSILLLGTGFARRSPTLKWWGLGYFVGGLGMVAIIEAYAAGSTLLSDFGSGLVLCAYGVLLLGLQSLSTPRVPRYWLIPAGLVWVAIAQIPPLTGSETLRMIAFGPLAALLMIALAWEAFRLPNRILARLPFVVLALAHAAFSVVRSAALIVNDGPAAHEFWLDATPIEGMFFLFCDAFLILNLVRSLRENELADEAYTDFLTGVLTSRRFSQLAEKVTKQGVCTVFILDIDHFKIVNDKYGHSAGDELLRELGKICCQEAHKSDLVGRLGGDEFAILVAGSDEISLSIATRIRASFVRKCLEKGWPANISIGTASSGSRQTSLDELISQADHRLYDAKARRVPPSRAGR